MSGILSQSCRFVLVGLLNTFFGLAIIFVAKGIGQFGDFESNLLGYTLGLLMSFFLNRKWTFRYSGRVLPTALRFAAAFLLAYLANLIIVFGLRDGAAINAYLAQAAGIIPYTVVFFLACRHFVFRQAASQI